MQDALREVDRRLLVQWLADYRRQHRQYDALWQDCQAPLRPEFFEVSFGQALRGGGPPSTAEPLELDCGEQTIRIAGRIDRIDTGTRGRRDGVQRAGLQDRRFDAIQRRGGRARAGPATARCMPWPWSKSS